MKELIEFIVHRLVDNKDSVSVEIDGETVKITAAKADIGKIIGKQGRTAKAIRTIVREVGAKDDKKFTVDIIEV